MRLAKLSSRQLTDDTSDHLDVITKTKQKPRHHHAVKQSLPLRRSICSDRLQYPSLANSPLHGEKDADTVMQVDII